MILEGHRYGQRSRRDCIYDTKYLQISIVHTNWLVPRLTSKSANQEFTNINFQFRWRVRIPSWGKIVFFLGSVFSIRVRVSLSARSFFCFLDGYFFSWVRLSLQIFFCLCLNGFCEKALVRTWLIFKRLVLFSVLYSRARVLRRLVEWFAFICASCLHIKYIDHLASCTWTYFHLSRFSYHLTSFYTAVFYHLASFCYHFTSF